MALAHLDPMWPPSAQNPGGKWVLMCVWGVCVGVQGCEMLGGLGGGGLITLIMFLRAVFPVATFMHVMFFARQTLHREA